MEGKKILPIGSDIDKETLEKSTKKLIRLPYYKLEELKKQEERKLKNPHKAKKKEDDPVSKIIQDTIIKPEREHKKKKKIVLSKVKEERESEDQAGDTQNLKKEPQKNISDNKINLKNFNDKLKMLKYSVGTVNQKKTRLSRKQRRLQEAQNTLGSFMINEDSAAEKPKKKINTVNLSKPSNNINNPITPGPGTKNISEKNIPSSSNMANVYSTNAQPKSDEIMVLGKKKKRLTKSKKAVYKSRLEKQQFLLSNLLKLRENGNEEEQLREEKEEQENPKVENKTEQPIIKPNPEEINDRHVRFSNIGNLYYNNYVNSPMAQYYNMGLSNPYYYYSQGNHMQHSNNFLMNPQTPARIFFTSSEQDVGGQVIPPEVKNEHAPKQQGNEQIDKDLSKPGFCFESKENKSTGMEDENFVTHLKSSYNLDQDVSKMKNSELNDLLKEKNDIKKINLKNLQKITDQKFLEEYIEKFEGIQKDSNVNKKIIREYVDQILDKEVDKKFGDFIVKMRDIYFKKKQTNPLKVKRRFVVGLREIDKHLKIGNVKCLFVAPNIEKTEGKDSLDEKLVNIFRECDSKRIPRFFGMNKMKLGKLARKKHSCVSILAFINVEGFEREFKDLLDFCQQFKQQFYDNHKDDKKMFEGNKFINVSFFESTEAN